MSERCTATTKAGNPCTAYAHADGFCMFHHADRDALQREGRAKGGKAKSTQARAKRRFLADALTPKELEGVIGSTLRQVMAGDLPPGVGSAVASLARAAVTIREASELEDRIAALEADTGTEPDIDPSRLTPQEREELARLRAKLTGEDPAWAR